MEPPFREIDQLTQHRSRTRQNSGQLTYNFSGGSRGANLFSGVLSPSRISLSVTQSAFASTSDRPLCFPRACVGLIGPRPSDYPHALSACYYFLPAVFLLALGLWSSLPARQLSLDTPYSFLTFSVFFFFFFFFKVLKG